MRKYLLLAIPALLWSSSSWATCATATVQVKDNLGATPNMEITNGASTNCVGEIALVEGGALVAAGNALSVQPGTGATWAVTQSGTWNLNNISGTISLPTGAATSANQPTNAAQASTTSGQTGTLVQGAVTTAAPTYTTAQTDPLSLTTAGALRVDGSGVTQPISAASLPLPSGASTSANQPTNSAQGATTSGQTGNLIQGAVTTAAPTYTTAQTDPLSLTTAGALRVDGSGVTQPVSGTVTANQGGTWNVGLSTGSNTVGKVDILGNAGATMDTSPGGTAATNALQIQGVAGMTAVTVSGTVTANQGGTWNINNISGTVSLPTGAATSANQPTNSAQGGTTSGQTGNLIMGAVTTSAPTYTTAQSDPLSLTTAGALRVDGSAVTQPVSGTVTANAGTGTFTVGGTVTANQGTSPWVDNMNQVNGANALALSDSLSNPTTFEFGANVLGWDATNTVWRRVQVAAGTGNLDVQCANCSGSGVSTADQAAFSIGSSLFAGGGGFYQTNPINGPLASGQQGEFQVTAQRAIFSNLRNSAGTEVGTSANPLYQVPIAGRIPQSNVMLCPTSVPGEYLPCGSAGALPLQVALQVGQFPSQVTGDACGPQNAKLGGAINLTAGGQVITGTPGKRTFICSIDVVSATAQNIALVEGTGAVCATNTFGLAGGTTAATGWNLAANTGLTKGSGNGTVYSPMADTNSAGANVCLLLSSTGQTSGQITYVQQ